MERFDLCITHRRADADRARALVRSLQAEEARVFVDDGETLTLLGLQRGVQEYLSRARFLAAFVDGGPTDARSGAWFLSAALVSALAEGEPGKRVVLLASAPVESLPPLLRDLPVLVVPPAEDTTAMATLAADLIERSGAVRGALGDVVPLVRPPWYPGIPAGPERFVGRHAALYAVHAALVRDRSASVCGEPRDALGGGRRGVGRTLLAQEYALRFGAAWPGGVVWLDGHGDVAMPPDVRERLRRDQIRAVARALGLTVTGLSLGDVEAGIARSIAARNEPVLWIVDDLPEGLDAGARDAWIPQDPLVRSLVVLRDGRDAGAPTVRLGGLARPEALSLLTRAWRPHTPEDEASAARIVDDLGGQPLAVDATGGVLGVGASPRAHAAVRAGLRKNADDVRASAEALFPFVPEAGSMPVAAAMARVVDQLAPEARDLVRLASHLVVAPLDPALAAAVLVAAEGGDHDAAVLRTEQGFSQLEQAGVALRQSADGGLDAPRSIHPMWVAVHRLRDPEPWRLPTLREGLVRVLAERLPASTDSIALLAVARLFAQKPEDLSEAALAHALGQTLLSQGDPDEAERAFRLAHGARERLAGADHRDTLTSLEGLAQAAWARDEKPEAVRMLEDVLAIRRDRAGDGDPATLQTMDLLARCYLEVGRKAESRALVEKVLDGRRRTLGAVHPATLDASARLAQILAADGDLHGATRIVDDVMSRVGRLPDRPHIPALETVVAVAATLRGGGELNPARRVLEAAVGHLRKLVGPDDPRVIAANTLYAKVLVDLDDIGGARRVETDTLAALLRVHGEAHPDTLTMMNNLGTTLSALGELALARQHLEKAWRLRTTVLGPRHTDTVVTGWNLHSVLFRMGMDSGPVLAELEWLLDARPDALSVKQRKVREALQDLVQQSSTQQTQDSGGWQKALLWVTKPFRRK